MTSTRTAAPRTAKPGPSLAQQAHRCVVQTATMLIDDFEQMLRPSQLTGAQYNVLRILRGAEPDGLCRNEIRDRMLTRMPDMTRLLDRMEQAGLVARAREREDRRMVATRLTRTGRQLLADLDSAAAAELQRRFRQLGATQLRTLIDLLDVVRKAP